MQSPDELVSAIVREDWHAVERVCREHPEKAHAWHTQKGFFPGNQESVLLPIHQAVAVPNPSIDAIRALIQAYPTGLQCQETTFQRLALHLAAQNPNVSTAMIQLLLEHAPKAAMEGDRFGRLALHYACCSGASVDTVDALLKDYPRSVSIRDDNGWLPIHVACRSGACFRVIQHLLDAFPESIVAETSKGNTPLDMMLCQNVLGRSSATLADSSLMYSNKFQNKGMKKSVK